MIEKCYYLKINQHDPYRNQALIEYLFNHIPDNSLVCLLYVNYPTVMIGRNSCAYKEADIPQLSAGGINLARNIANGETIYQDLGVLNFAFFVYQNNYNVIRQCKVLQKALESLSIENTVFDRESHIMLDGKCICQNNYYTSQQRCLHQGSITLQCDMENRKAVLNANDEAIKTTADHYAIPSVLNLNEVNKGISVNKLENGILQALANECGQVYELDMPDDYLSLTDKYQHFSYIYQINDNFTLIIQDYFSVGRMQIYLEIEHNHIIQVDCYHLEEATDFVDSVSKVFTSLAIDDISYRQKLFKNCSEKYFEDMHKIYLRIRKYGL